ncbi:phosphate ABC transporter substrate-binding/OmpA family protein [Oscillatoria sp. CS-180]|uniref:phosphate ABC transporter substrate-binding/OmpA family protein n=1 Tax=Oscillatoria sp. CS-180 TaxID=3021720 RepID=UPI00232E782A|nr:phosphate ABC transporter substrate-binding/OmpA family protein [Oscillatoria sp. CS-180]MDB9527597.1 phosphate ABC transporter substrate-binding/OmpA family protein [Oscillatoria sp. CS-180]
MTKTNYSALVGTFVITAGLLGGAVWYLNKTAPGLLGVVTPSNDQGAVTPRGKTELSLLGDTFSGYSTFRNEAFQTVLTEAGLTLNYADEFDQAARAAALAQGNADVIVTTLDQYLQQQPQGTIVGLIDRTVGADAVVLNTQKYTSLTSLLELAPLLQQAQSQGQSLKIAFAGDTPSEYLALVLDTKFDALNLSDFEIVRVADASEAWALMQDPNENVAIAVLWEPFVTQAQQQGYTVVLSSQDAPNSIVDVIVASDRVLQSNPAAISALLEKYYRRIDSNVRDASQFQTQIAEDGDLTAADAGAVLKGIDFFTAAEAQSWMTDGTLKQRIEAIAAVLVLSGRLNDIPANPETLFTDEYLREAAQNTQTLIELVRADNPELAERLMGETEQTLVVPEVTAAEVQAAPDIGNLNVQGKVEFDTGAAQLTPEGQQTLQTLAQEIREFNPETVAVRVIGHTSRTGSADLNQRLSQERAQVVVDYLRGQGIQHNVVAEGKGFYLPLSGIDPADPRQQRTEIRLVRVN